MRGPLHPIHPLEIENPGRRMVADARTGERLLYGYWIQAINSLITLT
jgi:hypothetical protein